MLLKEKIYNDNLKRYSRVGKFDKDKLAEYVVKAKGPQKSLSKFAKECGVSPSTLSRIVNKQNFSPSTDDLIIKIAVNADPDSKVTFDQLMRANGKENKIDLTAEVNDILRTEIYARGYKIRNYSLLAQDEAQFQDGWYNFNIEYHTNAVPVLLSDSSIPMALWGFDILGFDILTSEIESERLTRSLPFEKLLKLWGLRLCESTTAGKISIVIFDEIEYESLNYDLTEYGIELPKKAELMSSIILIDIEHKRVKEEFEIPIEGDKKQSSFFEQPKIKKAKNDE